MRYICLLLTVDLPSGTYNCTFYNGNKSVYNGKIMLNNILLSMEPTGSVLLQIQSYEKNIAFNHNAFLHKCFLCTGAFL